MKKLEYVLISAIILFLITIDAIQIVKNREFQAQIDELKLIVDQKFLPALILDELNIRQ